MADEEKRPIEVYRDASKERMSKIALRSKIEFDRSAQERDTRSAKEKWKARNQDSLERQRRRRKPEESPSQATGNRPIRDNAIDSVPRRDLYQTNKSGSGTNFNSTFITCVNGTLYYVDLIGSPVYATSNDPNFPIAEPS